MKKVVANLLLIVVLTITCLGCGDTQNIENAADSAESISQEVVEDEIEAEKETEDDNASSEETSAEDNTITDESTLSMSLEENVVEVDENAVDFSKKDIGDTVTLGRCFLPRTHYDCEPEDFAYKDDLEWTIIDKKDNRLLLFCNDAVIMMDHYAPSWKDSKIRYYLNEYFYYYAFNEKERGSIVDYTNDDLDQTTDKLFLLSLDEFKNYENEIRHLDKDIIKGVKGKNTVEYDWPLWGRGGSDRILTRSYKERVGASQCSDFFTSDGKSHTKGSDNTSWLVVPAMWIDATATFEMVDDNSCTLKYDNISEGENFYFGEWEQDLDFSNGPEPIEWQILEAQDGVITAISVKGLDDRYDGHDTFDKKRMRKADKEKVITWLNSMFYYQAFSDADKELIDDKKVEDIGWSHLWLLDEDEEKYYSNFSFDEYENTRYCRLRRYNSSTSGSDVESIDEMIGRWNEIAGSEDKYVKQNGAGIRPVICIKMDSLPATSISESNNERYVDGDIIVYGNYEQDNDLDNGKEPIEWVVLESNQEKVLVVSKYILDCHIYNTVSNTKEIQNQWDVSELRRWLNTEFAEEAFSEDELSKIVLTQTITDGDCYDKVYVPSHQEKGQDAAETTAYARAQGVFGEYVAGVNDNEGYFWLRPDRLTVVSHPAEVLISWKGERPWAEIDRTDVGVRPMMWISLE